MAFRFAPEPGEMLNGVTSNTLDAAHNALLSPQGKIIGVFVQKLVDDQTCILVSDAYAAQALTGEFGKYAPFSKTGWEQLSEPVWYDLNGDADPGDGMVLPLAAGRLIVGGNYEPTVSEEEFTTFRLDHQLPVHGVDFQDEMILNVFPDGYVSYTKGCFVGQEVVARVHNLSAPQKKLVVKYENECSDQEKQRMTSRQADASGRVRGFVFISTDDKGKRAEYQAMKVKFKK